MLLTSTRPTIPWYPHQGCTTPIPMPSGFSLGSPGTCLSRSVKTPPRITSGKAAEPAPQPESAPSNKGKPGQIRKQQQPLLETWDDAAGKPATTQTRCWSSSGREGKDCSPSPSPSPSGSEEGATAGCSWLFQAIKYSSISRSEVELLVELVKLVVQLGELHVKLQKGLILFKKGFSTSISSRFNRSSAQLQPRVQTVGRGTRGHSSWGQPRPGIIELKKSSSWKPFQFARVIVAKCFWYGRYICVNISKRWENCFGRWENYFGRWENYFGRWKKLFWHIQ